MNTDMDIIDTLENPKQSLETFNIFMYLAMETVVGLATSLFFKQRV